MLNKDLMKILKRFDRKANISIRVDEKSVTPVSHLSATVDSEGAWNIIIHTQTPTSSNEDKDENSSD